LAGFLDKNTRIIDMVLTSHGKQLLSRGDLRFCYWIPFDDEIDYQPFLSESGSLSEEFLSSSIYQAIETTPIREATTGYRAFNRSGSDFTNVHNPIFTKALDQYVLPRTSFPITAARTVESKQRKVERIYQNRDEDGKFENSIQPRDLGIERYDSSTFTIELSYTRDSFPVDFQPEGFFLRMMKSGSSGWTEVRPRRDMGNDLSYNNDLLIFTGRKGG